jgi:hypothetical protein
MMSLPVILPWASPVPCGILICTSTCEFDAPHVVGGFESFGFRRRFLTEIVLARLRYE